MKPAPGRATLAAAIVRRNAAAKAVDAAREAFAECAGPEAASYSPSDGRIGEKYADLKSARYAAADRLADIAEMQTSYLEKNSGDRVGLHRVCLHEFGKNADETLADARRDLDVAEKAEAEMAAAMGKVDLLLADAERELAEAARAVEENVQGVLHAEAVHLASALSNDARAILQKVAALAFVTRGINFQHSDLKNDSRHPFYQASVMLRWLGSIGRDTGVIDELRAIDVARQEGTAPWIAAAICLSVDANAPLPTDPKMAVAA